MVDSNILSQYKTVHVQSSIAMLDTFCDSGTKPDVVEDQRLSSKGGFEQRHEDLTRAEWTGNTLRGK